MFKCAEAVWLILCCLAVFGCMGRANTTPSPDPQHEFPPLVSAAELAETNILPHTQGTITPGKNQVYCATFQLAWNEMRDSLVKEPIRLDGDPPMAELLNQRSFEKSDLADDCYLAISGIVENGVVDRLHRELNERFPHADLEVPDAADDTGIYAYAYLEKTLAFRAAFDRLDDSLKFPIRENAVPVAAFGTTSFTMNCRRDEILKSQVTVLCYTSDDEFVLRLNTRSQNDEMVLAKIPAKKTLAETITDAQQRIEQGAVVDYKQTLQEGESLVIPIVSMNVKRVYTELVGKQLQNESLTHLHITEAIQGIRFRLDETGAKLSSEAEFGISSEPEPPRHFVFDRPFLFYLKQKDKDAPYFAMWIETAEVLEKLIK